MAGLIAAFKTMARTAWLRYPPEELAVLSNSHAALRESLPGPALAPAAGTLWRRFVRHLPASIAALCGLWIASVVFTATDRRDDQRLMAELEQSAEAQAREIEVQLHRAAVPVAALAVHLSTSDQIERPTFETVARRMLSSGVPMISIQWRPRADRTASSSADDFPVLHEVLAEAGAPWRGQSLSQDARLWQAALMARDDGQPRSTLPLAQGWSASGQPVLVIVWPVYRGGDVPESVEQRRAQLSGFVTALYPARGLLRTAMRDARPSRSNIRFFVEHVEADDELTATEVASYSLANRALEPALDTPGVPLPGNVRVKRAITVHGQTWQILFNFPAAIVDGLRSFAPWAWLIAMLLATVGVVGYLVLQASSRSAIERLVSERTAALTSA
jgi:hypothetical protein